MAESRAFVICQRTKELDRETCWDRWSSGHLSAGLGATGRELVVPSVLSVQEELIARWRLAEPWV